MPVGKAHPPAAPRTQESGAYGVPTGPVGDRSQGLGPQRSHERIAPQRVQAAPDGVEIVVEEVGVDVQRDRAEAWPSIRCSI